MGLIEGLSAHIAGSSLSLSLSFLLFPYDDVIMSEVTNLQEYNRNLACGHAVVTRVLVLYVIFCYLWPKACRHLCCCPGFTYNNSIIKLLSCVSCHSYLLISQQKTSVASMAKASKDTSKIIQDIICNASFLI